MRLRHRAAGSYRGHATVRGDDRRVVAGERSNAPRRCGMGSVTLARDDAATLSSQTVQKNRHDYSVLSTTLGFNRDARQAGSQHAPAATRAIVIITAPSVVGSVGWT